VAVDASRPAPAAPAAPAPPVLVAPPVAAEPSSLDVVPPEPGCEPLGAVDDPHAESIKPATSAQRDFRVVLPDS
jgi:hypothetical protein